MIRLLLADDHKIIRDGIKSLLAEEPQIQVVGEAANGVELLDILTHTTAEVALIDINMPEMNGFDTAKRMKEQFPTVKVLALSMLDHENYINQMLDAGASGFLLKTAGRQELVHAICSVAGGTPYICSEIALSLLQKLRNIQSGQRTSVENKEKTGSDLSKREIEVLQLIAQGYTNAEIAEQLFTSRRTIETHRQNLLEKTSSNNTATLIRYAISNGLID